MSGEGRIGAGWRVDMAWLLGLAVLIGLLTFRHIGALGLYSDDWDHLHLVTTLPLGQLARSWPMDYRPFDMLPWVVLHALFGQALAWYYAVLFGIRVATAWLLYALVRRLCRSALLAGAVAALWSVYPADSTVYWLTCFAYRLGMLFLLAGLVLLARRPRAMGAAYWGSVACCALCLACHEIYLGLLLLLPFGADLAGRGAGAVEGTHTTRGGQGAARLRRVGPYLALIGACGIYRIWLGPHVLHFMDGKGGEYRTGAGGVLGAVLDGAGMVLVRGWQMAAGTVGALPPTAFDGRALITWMAVTPGWGVASWAILGLYVAAAASALGGWLWRERRGWWESARPGIVALGLGVAGVCLGYAAVALTADAPSLDGVATRLNAAALPGASLLLCGALWTLAGTLPVAPRTARLVFAAAAGAFVLLGSLWSERTASTYARAWADQGQFWRALVRTVPGVRPGTLIVVLAADSRTGDGLTGLQPWGIGPAVRLLYGEAALADYLTPEDMDLACVPWRSTDNNGFWHLHLSGAGVQPHGSAEVISYERVLVVRYSAAQDTMRVVDGSVVLRAGCVLRSNGTRLMARSGAGTVRW